MVFPRISREQAPRWLVFLGSIGLYWLTAYYCLHLATVGKNVSPFWFPAGVGFATLFIFGRRYWLAVFFGAFFANYFNSYQFSLSFLFAIGNTGNAILSSVLFEKIRKLGKSNDLFVDNFALPLSSIVGASVSATNGILTLAMVGGLPVNLWVATWTTWWSGDSIGQMIGGAFFISLFEKRELLHPRARLSPFQATAVFAIFLGLSILILIKGPSFSSIFLVFPLILLANEFFFELGLRTLTLAIAVILTFATVKGWGVFVGGSRPENLHFLQFFVMSLGLSTLFLNYVRRMNITDRFVHGMLIVCWCIAGVVVTDVEKREARAFSSKTDQQIDDAHDLIREKLHMVQEVLRAGAGFVNGSNKVDFQEWKRFVKTIDPTNRFPGILGLGLVYRMPKDKPEHLVRFANNLDIATYQPYDLPNVDLPPSDSGYYIYFLEPLETNERAIGLNLASESSRKAAADLSAQKGTFAISSPIRLVQRDEKQNAFLAFFPVYRTREIPTSEEKRKEDHLGWVYAPIIMTKLVQSSLKGLSQLTLSPILHFTREDGARIPYSDLTEEDKRRSVVKQSRLTDGEATFSIDWSSDTPLSVLNNDNIGWSGFIGNFLSLVCAYIIAGIYASRDRATQLAERLRKELNIKNVNLVQSAKLASLGEMAGGVAHEINNPLAIILGNAQQIRRQMQANPPVLDTIPGRIEKIEKTVGRIEKIVRGLRKFSRDGGEDPFEPVSVIQLFEEVRALCEEKFRQHNISLEVEPFDNGLTFLGRSVQISQVLLNLLNNAHDAIEKLPERWIRVKVEERDSNLRISVTDSGKGIPADVADKIMQPFFTTKPVGKGTGLGLSISRGIVESHHGRFYLDSDSQNTRFVIELPSYFHESKKAA